MTDNGIDLSGLQDHGIKGFIRFSVKAKDTDENKQIHKDFKAFSNVVCGDDYTLALKTLLMYYSDRGLFEALYERIAALEARVLECEHRCSAPKEEVNDGGAF